MKMNILSFQALVKRVFDKDTANKLITEINKFQTPVGCVLHVFVKHMSHDECSILSGRYATYTFRYRDAGNFLCGMHVYIFQDILLKYMKFYVTKINNVYLDGVGV